MLLQIGRPERRGHLQLPPAAAAALWRQLLQVRRGEWAGHLELPPAAAAAALRLPLLQWRGRRAWRTLPLLPVPLLLVLRRGRPLVRRRRLPRPQRERLLLARCQPLPPLGGFNELQQACRWEHMGTRGRRCRCGAWAGVHSSGKLPCRTWVWAGKRRAGRTNTRRERAAVGDAAHPTHLLAAVPHSCSRHGGRTGVGT